MMPRITACALTILAVGIGLMVDGVFLSPKA